jgi:hypothetical protein
MQAMFVTKLKVMAVTVMSLGLLGLGAGRLTHYVLAEKQAPQGQPSPQSPAAQGAELPKPNPAEKEQARTDVFGDSLPAGALVRMGTVRLRHHHRTGDLPTAFSPDGKTVATCGNGTIKLWDMATGKLLWRLSGNHYEGKAQLRGRPMGRWKGGGRTWQRRTPARPTPPFGRSPASPTRRWRCCAAAYARPPQSPRKESTD